MFIACSSIASESYKYGNRESQTFDVYKENNIKNAPVILMVHGGGWKRGDKAHLNVIKNKVPYFIEKGYIFISMNYTLVPDANPLDQTLEVLKAISFIQNNADTLNINPEQINVIGHSAGAHLVALAITSHPLQSRVMLKYPVQSAVLLDSAGYDIVSLMNKGFLFEIYRNAFGNDQSFWKDASPYHALRGKVPPILLVCSKLRNESCSQAYSFYDKLLKYKNNAVLYPVNLSHSEINNMIGLDEEYTKDIHGFLGQFTGR